MGGSDEEALQLLESSFLSITPLHLLRLTLLSEVCQENCNGCKVRDESAIISQKSQESMNVLLHNGSWVVLDCFDLSQLRLNPFPTNDMPKIVDLISSKVALPQLFYEPCPEGVPSALPSSC